MPRRLLGRDVELEVVILEKDVLGHDSDEDEEDESANAVPRRFLCVKTLLTTTEQMDLTIGLLRRTLCEIFDLILGNRGGKSLLDPRYVVAKAILSDDTWGAAIARPLPPTSPGFGEISLSTQFVVDLAAEESFRVVDFLQLLVLSKVHSQDSKFVVDGDVGSRIAWLDEGITVKMVLDQQRVRDGSPLSLHLLRDAHRPPATLRVEVTGTQEREDINGKSYTSYAVMVRQNDLVEWTVHKRFSDFVACHAALQAQSRDTTDHIKHLPRLPARDTLGKHVLLLESKAALVARRVEGLQSFLNALLEATQDKPNAVILSFLGMLNITQNAQTRPTMHISRLGEEARVGDLVLFRSVYPLSQLQRVATGSDFDHIGIVVHPPRPSSPSPCREAGRFPPQPHLLEATGDGVTVLPLVPRLQAYHHFRCCEAIALRRLEKRGAVDDACLEDFLRVAQTRPYKLTLADLAFQSKEIRPGAGTGGPGTTTGQAAPAPAASESEEEGGKSVENLFPDLEQRHFFCSALVAAALKAYGVIPPSANENFFWPGSFQSGKKGRLFFETAIEDGFVYGAEMEIDCRELELGRLRPVPPPSHSRPLPIHQESPTVHVPTATFQPSFF